MIVLDGTCLALNFSEFCVFVTAAEVLGAISETSPRIFFIEGIFIAGFLEVVGIPAGVAATAAAHQTAYTENP